MENHHYIITGPNTSAMTIILAHGAGAPMDSPSMETIAELLAERNLKLIRFEFPYMRKRRMSGSKGPPDSSKKLQIHWLSVIEDVGNPKHLIIGGKSMGGRIASMVADEAGVSGLICLGYPFHPPAKPERLRVDHLKNLKTPSLILQGERDAFGRREEIAGYDLSSSIRVEFLPDGDHSLSPRKKSGFTFEQNITHAADMIEQFVSTRAAQIL